MSGKTAEQSYNWGQTFNLSSISSDLNWDKEDILSDYIFTHWTETPQDEGTKYEDKESVMFCEKTTDLYAQWKKVWFNFRYVANYAK